MPSIPYNTVAYSDNKLKEAWPIHNCLETFLKKGGRIFFWEGEKDKNFPFQIKQKDILYPICSGGQCRSQVLHLMLNEFKGEFKVTAPHASRVGYDPYNDELMIDHLPKINDKFSHAFGAKKKKQLGFTFASKSPRPIEELKKYYDEKLWQCKKDVRQVYISFSKPVHVVLKRLIEVNRTLNNVIVLAFPFDDEITFPPEKLGMKSGSVEAYHAFYNKLKSQFIYDSLSSN